MHPETTARWQDPLDHTFSTMFRRPDQVADPLYVITPIVNQHRWRTRWKLYEDHAKRVHNAGAILYTIEVAFGHRDFAITRPDHPRHIQLRTKHELWLKERLINIAIRRLSQDVPHWKYVAWIDGDVQFARSDWANETVHRLQHHPWVQMWGQYQDLTHDYRVIGTSDSFAYRYTKRLDQPTVVDGKMGDTIERKPGHGHHGGHHGHHYPGHGHHPHPPQTLPKHYPGAPGLAWAATHEGLDTTGGLLDVCILGAGDWYMAHALVGRLNELSMRSQFTPAYKAAMLEWAERAKALHRNVGVVDGLANHYWHGPKDLRKYRTRDQILVDHQYDPRRDLSVDAQGLWQLRPDAIALRDDVRDYFANRNEDAI